MTFPNLVIGGAPKCGTSSLFNWLVDHPEVCGSTPKETFFLMDRENPLRRKDCNFHDHGLDSYSSFFRNCTSRHKVIVEATTHNLYQRTALDVLAELPTKPKLLFVLRKPSERIFSSFAYSKNNLGSVRSGLSFAEFIRLIGDHPECQGSWWARGASAYVLPREILYSRYIEFLSEWRERLGATRLRVLVFERMRMDPKRMMQSLCDWLGIDPSFYDAYDFAARNRTVPVRSPRVQRIARTLGGNIPGGRLKDSVKRLYLQLQSKRARDDRSSADEAAMAELDEEFRPFNERLASEFGLCLDEWNRPAGYAGASPDRFNSDL